MSAAAFVYRLYDRWVESERPTGLVEVVDGAKEPAGGRWRLRWTDRGGDPSGETAEMVHDAADLVGDKRLQVHYKGGRLLFYYGEIAVEWDWERRQINIDRWEEGALPVSDFLERLAAPIAALCDGRRQWIALHASAVVDREGGAWVAIGESGAGKSTAALELSRRGYLLAADDLVMIDVEARTLYGASPTVRLVEQREAVPEAQDARPVPSGIDKRWFRLDREAAPAKSGIAGIVWLDPTEQEPASAIEELRGQEGVSRVLAQTFSLSPGPADHKIGRFRAVCDLIRAVPVYRVSYAQSDRGAPAQVDLMERLILDGGGDP